MGEKPTTNLFSCDKKESRKKNTKRDKKVQEEATEPWWCVARFRNDNANSRASQSYLRLAVAHESQCNIRTTFTSKLVQNIIAGEWQWMMSTATHMKRGIGHLSTPATVDHKESQEERQAKRTKRAQKMYESINDFMREENPVKVGISLNSIFNAVEYRLVQ